MDETPQQAETEGRGASPSPSGLVTEAPSVLTSDAMASEDEKAATLLAGRFGGTVEAMADRVKTIRALRAQYGTGLKWIGIAPCDVTQDPKIFFVLGSDTPEQLIARYMRVYDEEAEQFRREVLAEKAVQANALGMSGMRELRLFVQTPHKLREFLKILDPTYWEDERHVAGMERDYPVMGGKA